MYIVVYIVVYAYRNFAEHRSPKGPPVIIPSGIPHGLD